MKPVMFELGRIKTNGFTLIETMIVLAITSLLVLIAYAGQTELRSRARFNDAIERTVSALSQAQAEADATVNSNTTTGGRVPGRIFWGNRVQFSDESSTIVVTPLKVDDSASVISTVPESPAYNITIPWGVTFEATGSEANNVFYVRDFTTGRGKVFMPLLSQNWSAGTQYTSSTNYIFTDPENEWDLRFEDDRGHRATIKIKTPAGDLSRVFQ